jgi:hypothetical protein
MMEQIKEERVLARLVQCISRQGINPPQEVKAELRSQEKMLVIKSGKETEEKDRGVSL